MGRLEGQSTLDYPIKKDSIIMTTRIWTQENTVAEALELPLGCYAADLGFLCQQSVSPDDVLTAAQAFKDSETPVTVASQSALLVKAQEQGLALTDWAKLVLV